MLQYLGSGHENNPQIHTQGINIYLHHQPCLSEYYFDDGEAAQGEQVSLGSRCISCRYCYNHPLYSTSVLLLTIPMAFLLSTLLTYGRHSLDNELVILRTSGMDFSGISKPVFILGISCFLLNIAVSFYIGPKSSIGLRDEITRIIKTRTPLAIEEGTFNASFKDIVIMIRKKPSEDTVRGIFIYDGRNKNEPRIMMAREGKISMSEGFYAKLLLKDGFIHIAKGNSTTEIFFERYNLILTLESDLPSRKNAEFTPV